jgi:hypothetical protein
MQKLRRFVHTTFTTVNAAIWFMAFSGSLAMAQMPGTTSICAVKLWVLGIAGALAVGGVAWLGSMMTWARNHADGMHPFIEKLPGLAITFGAAAVGTVFGLAIC